MDNFTWRDYSLPHVIYNQYKNNTVNTLSVVSGRTYFLMGITDRTEAVLSIITIVMMQMLILVALSACGVLTIPSLVLTIPIGTASAIWIILSLLDTYSTRKYRVQLNAIKSINFILDKNPNKRRGFW